MVDIFAKKNKFAQEAFERTYFHRKDSFSEFEKETFNMNLKASNASIDYSYIYKETPNFTWHDQDYETRIKGVIKIGKEQIVVEESTGRRVEDYSKLVELICAYDYAKKHLNEIIVDGMTKKQLKEMSTEGLEKLLDSKNVFINQIKNMIIDSVKGEKIEKTGQELFDENFGKGIVNFDNVVEANLDMALKAKEKLTEHQNRIESVKQGFARVGDKLKIIPNAIAKKIKENGEYRQERKEQLRLAKEEKDRRSEIIDELSI